MITMLTLVIGIILGFLLGYSYWGSPLTAELRSRDALVKDRNNIMRAQGAGQKPWPSLTPKQRFTRITIGFALIVITGGAVAWLVFNWLKG